MQIMWDCLCVTFGRSKLSLAVRLAISETNSWASCWNLLWHKNTHRV